jgi:transposase
MDVTLTDAERTALDAAAAGERRVRLWRRYRALQLLADGLEPPAVARALGCSQSSVYNWAAMWRDGGLPGLRGRGHGGGRARALGGAGERMLEDLLGQDPQARGHRATGWTVPLLLGELGAAGYPAGERTVRRTLRRLGWRWKRPKFVLGRPDPAYEAKKRPSPSGRG